MYGEIEKDIALQLYTALAGSENHCPQLSHKHDANSSSPSPPPPPPSPSLITEEPTLPPASVLVLDDLRCNVEGVRMMPYWDSWKSWIALRWRA
ncbi:hypothetical protein CONPUDRAFT_84084 [Coniophora puteana RWD-64-598 SS2]|uniref:Uncharacterized protein n=1 Tax=Coniophora puteana (strain RWD-64-598) TaxID=741705 RepID=A0A5M3MFI1_CONPW|nr:uncharacterized protein CONPUDRAFT_84084 [Coniophora puteana RWD-64-598 SS2]EIW77680.1 hypothetical protein CONPUDRAFT_84084 [Coniophora puteana RWD-64-598 SS2]